MTDAAAEVPADRQVIRTASLTVEIDRPSSGRKEDADAEQKALTGAVDDASVQVEAMAGANGYVSDSNGSGTTRTFTLRVTGGDYPGVLDRLAALGTATAEKETTQDVTLQLADVAGRIDSAQKTIAQFRILLTKADKVGDVIAVESELSSREADLESLLRQQVATKNQVSLSTISVTLVGRLTAPTARVVAAAAVVPAPTGFIGGLTRGWHALIRVVNAGAVFVGAVLPFLPGVALVVAIVAWIRRRNRRTGSVSTPPVREPIV